MPPSADSISAAQHCAKHIDTTFVALGPVKVAFLGVVQGISELLPISSTAHMRAIPALLGWPDPGSAFSAAMQLAALAAVVTYFWSELVEVTGGTLTALRTRDYSSPSFKLALAIAIASVPLGLGGVLLSPVLNRCGSPLRSEMVVGIACVVMAALLALAELLARHCRDEKALTLWDALLIGLAQMGALIPGVSRSGSTLTAALGLGFTRKDAAHVSFLLGIPAIAMAGLLELWVLYKSGLGTEGWIVLGVGLATSSLSSFAAIWGLMRYLETLSTWPFVLYRLAFGALLIAQARHLF